LYRPTIIEVRGPAIVDQMAAIDVITDALIAP
jgi:hypothetical protein